MCVQYFQDLYTVNKIYYQNYLLSEMYSYVLKIALHRNIWHTYSTTVRL